MPVNPGDGIDAGWIVWTDGIAVAMGGRMRRLYLGSFVGRVIVQYDVDIQLVWCRAVDLLEEIEKLGSAVPFVAFADDKT